MAKLERIEDDGTVIARTDDGALYRIEDDAPCIECGHRGTVLVPVPSADS